MELKLYLAVNCSALKLDKSMVAPSEKNLKCRRRARGAATCSKSAQPSSKDFRVLLLQAQLTPYAR
jgi:hypothetical protein